MLGSGDVALQLMSLLRGLAKRTGHPRRVRRHEHRQRGEARSKPRSSRATITLPAALFGTAIWSSLGPHRARSTVAPSLRCSHKRRPHRVAARCVPENHDPFVHPPRRRSSVDHNASLASVARILLHIAVMETKAVEPSENIADGREWELWPTF